MFEMSKDVEFEGKRYKIGRLKAIDGAWVLRLVMAGLQGAAPAEGEVPVAQESAMSESEWRRMTRLLLGVCSQYNVNGLAIPVLTDDGSRFAIPDLEYDVVAVQALTMHSQAFNMGPFFAGGGFERILKSLGLSSPSPSPNSTPSSGDPSSPASGGSISSSTAPIRS